MTNLNMKAQKYKIIFLSKFLLIILSIGFLSIILYFIISFEVLYFDPIIDTIKFTVIALLLPVLISLRNFVICGNNFNIQRFKSHEIFLNWFENYTNKSWCFTNFLIPFSFIFPNLFVLACYQCFNDCLIVNLIGNSKKQKIFVDSNSFIY